MSIIQGNAHTSTGGYQIERSLRFNSADSAYLNRTAGTPTSNSAWTYSVWLKRGLLSTGVNLYLIHANNAGNTLSTELFVSTNDIIFFREYGPSAYTSYLETTQKLRDPAAWYHIVLAYNPSNGTSSDKVRLYINGVRVTAFLTTIYPSSTSQATAWNTSGNVQKIGFSGTNTFDGYMTEINFIDGQGNLTQNDFGETDSATGVWKPKKYGGTYGNNGFYLPFSDNTISVLSDTATVTAPFGGTATNARVADGAYVTSNTSTGSSFTFVQYDFGSAVWLSRFSITNLYFTGGTSTFQVQYGNDPTWNTFTVAGSLSVTGSAQTFSGTIMGSGRYIRLAPTAFGTNGQANVDAFVIYRDELGKDFSGNSNNWLPNNFSVTAGTGNDSLVDVPTSYGTDTGAGGEVRGNYCTWNPLQAVAVDAGAGVGAFNLSDGNLKSAEANASNTCGYVCGTMAVSSGKWYWEVECTSIGGSYGEIGIHRTSAAIIYSGSTNNDYRYRNDGTKQNGSTGSSYGASLATGNIVGVALDLDAGTLTFYKNNASQGVAFSGISGEFTPSVGDIQNSTANTYTANFGQRPFTYTAPSGFKALCTTNLTTPTITKGNQYFDVLTWNGAGGGSGATRSITGLNFQPDFLWEKARSSGSGHQLLDVLRGVGQNKVLASNSTGTEPTPANTESLYGWLSSFNSDGFTTTNGTSTWDNWNKSGDTYVAWNWKANGAGSSNTAGNITSTVSVNTTSGFSIVTYTGNGSANQTVGHGLGVAPAFGILKDRDTNSNNNQWQVFHTTAGDKYGYLSTTAGFTGTAEFYPTSGSSTTVTVGRGSPVATSNESGDRYVMYLFTPVAGYSAFGSFTGNNSLANGPFVYLGFRPAFLLIKRSDSTSDWFMLDNDRPTFNVIGAGNGGQLAANQTYTESTLSTYAIADLLSNGFKVRHDMTYGYWNVSGGTYIYAAFAESPFKYSLAR